MLRIDVKLRDIGLKLNFEFPNSAHRIIGTGRPLLKSKI